MGCYNASTPTPIPMPTTAPITHPALPTPVAAAPLLPPLPLPLADALAAAASLALLKASNPAVTVNVAYSICVLASVVVLPTNPKPGIEELPVQMAWEAEVPP